MNLISKEDFAELTNYKADICISIFIPAHRAGVEVNEKADAIVFKNALQAVNTQLQNRDVPPPEIEALLAPGFELYNDKEEIFWNNQLDGLAVFIANDFFKVIKLPYAVDEDVYLNNSFLVAPLLPAITNNEEFYLLTISKHDARFYKGDFFGLQRLEVEGLPDGMDDVVHFEEKEGKQLLRQGDTGGHGVASFHGHGAGQPDEKANIAMYFQEVDKTLFGEVLHDKNVPLVLAGVEYLIPIYKSVSKYNFIADAAITGNPEHESQHALFAKAHELLTPYFNQPVNKALQNYYNQIATPLTSSMPEKLIPASFYAQISDLFICRNAHVWGTFDEAAGALEIHPEKEPGDECLLNKAAANTYLNGGGVYLLQKEKMPKDSIMAAVLRF